MNKQLLLVFMSMLLVASLAAQPLSSSSYETKLELGAEAIGNMDYYNALVQYEEAFEDRQDADLIPIIADLHYKLRDYRQAERWYNRLLRRDPENQYVDLRYNFGRTLKMQGKYAEAVEEFQTFIASTTDTEMKAKAQRELNGAELALSMPGNAQGVTVEALGRDVNQPSSEYSPAMSPDGSLLYFSSINKEEIPNREEGDNDPEKYARIFVANKTDRGWQNPEPLGPEINRPGFDNTNVSLSPDGRRMYFNRIKLQGLAVAEAKIYMSEGGDGDWSSANEVAGVNGNWRAQHPAVGELFGNEVLFFTSDMDGGEGGMDIYYATYEGDGKYADPVNLGEVINTPGDEYTPWYHDGTLYFSTDSRATLGGFDIYYSVWNGSSWSEPVNMGKAYNSPADELYFRLSEDGYAGFFTSNRPEGRSLQGKTCCEDVYGFEIARIYADLVVGTFDAPERQPLMGASLQLIEMTGGARGTTRNQTQAEGNRFDFGLELDKAYMVIATHPDYFPDSTTLNTAGLTESQTFEHRFFLTPKPREPEFDTIVTEQPFVLENILYDFDDDRILEASEVDLQVVYDLLVEYPDMKIELGSHTDARGDDDYNRDLSQRRAESARRWLVRKGIDRDRIASVGYGETVPQVVSERVAAKFDFLNAGDVLTEDFINALATEEQQEEAHRLNRRTEFKITEGPTSIIIRRVEERTEDANDRGSNIGAQNDPVEIHPMSSLYGQSDLRGVPIMQFEQRTFDLGTVTKGQKRTFEYHFTNRGDTDLVIDLVSACDCTTTNQDELRGRSFKPGESGVLKVTFDSTEKDESETIDVDIFLQNNDKQGNPIVEMLNYSFDLKQ
ncbi:MAG: PD40 domain-containing protein [Lewinella sp.]|nr:PD40 domain-containing protein [Lewinella sp.]